MTKPLAIETPLVDQFMKIVDTAYVKGLEIDYVEVNEPTWIRFCNEADLRWGDSSKRRAGEYVPSLYGVKLYRRDYAHAADNQFIVKYKPLEEPSWTIQVVNNLTGDIAQVMKVNGANISPGNNLELSVGIGPFLRGYDISVPLP